MKEERMLRDHCAGMYREVPVEDAAESLPLKIGCGLVMRTVTAHAR